MDIIDFTAEHAEAFKQLNLAWITEHWTVEAADLKALNSPFESIIDVGGAILIEVRFIGRWNRCTDSLGGRNRRAR